uniref:Uncharacterized protein n=1 Tax=Siphoviridae sp. ctXQ014 TaxID=2825542 RepID=A0A8S5PM93_9CAUD|nr:MAG TPA: hypothetical protein [Siphoviridae sp. ctXQ014]DAL61813.1 MAG TPA_asm: hypothetical protein [Caudoviricetes sp.]
MTGRCRGSQCRSLVRFRGVFLLVLRKNGWSDTTGSGSSLSSRVEQ